MRSAPTTQRLENHGENSQSLLNAGMSRDSRRWDPMPETRHQSVDQDERLQDAIGLEEATRLRPIPRSRCLPLVRGTSQRGGPRDSTLARWWPRDVEPRRLMFAM
jgi:hypothetical protein